MTSEHPTEVVDAASALPHPLFPQQSPDERARHGFLVEFKRLLGSRYRDGIRQVFEHRQGGHPQSAGEAATLLDQDDYFRFWTALARSQHELYVDSTGACVERQLEALREACAHYAAAALPGSLRLDPQLPIPPYQSGSDTHCVPGSYFVELGNDDVYAGARYELGITLYTLGHHGRMNDAKGQAGVRFIRERFADLAPRRILDLGCTAGNSTLPYVDAWPQAEVHGIDLSAPCLRFAHARSRALGKAVHYSQQNAERTDFPDAHFDLVVSHILLHEVSRAALQNIFAECRRLLRPGGVMLHIEVPVRNARLDALGQALAGWDAAYNNEPFWNTLHQLDLPAMTRAAGFDGEIFDVDLDPALTAFVNKQPWMACGARVAPLAGAPS